MPKMAEKVPISGNRENASALGLAVDPCKNLVLGRQFPFADTERRKVRSVHQMVRARARDAQHRSKLFGIQHIGVVLICHPFHIHPPFCS